VKERGFISIAESELSNIVLKILIQAASCTKDVETTKVYDALSNQNLFGV